MPPFFIKKTSRGYHKAVVIGDGLAMGVGDRVVLGSSGGVASRLEALIKQRSGAGVVNSKRPRTRWDVLNRGEAAATSHEWLPGAPLFEQTFGPASSLAEAEVVVIVLGTQDILQGSHGMDPAVIAAPPPGLKQSYEPEQYCSTVRNLEILCAHLLDSSPTRRVLLLDVPQVRNYRLVTEGDNAEVLTRLNLQIVNMIKRFNERRGQEDPNPKRLLWVHGSPMKIVLRAWATNSDAVHMSPKGYREYAKWLKDPVQEAMLQVELAWWTKDL